MKKIVSLVTVLFILTYTQAQPKLHQSLGNVQNFENKDPFIIFSTSSGTLRITAYSAVCLRVQISKTNTFDDFSYAVQAKPVAGLIKVTDTGSSFELRTDSCYLIITKNPARISLYNNKGELLNEDEPAFGTGWIGEEVSTYKKMQDDEKFIGLGEKTGNLNRRGEGFTNWNTDYFAYPSNGDPIYASIPFYMGVHHNVVYGLFLDNTYKSHFNFGASNNRFSSFTAEDGEMNYYLFASANVAGIIESYTALTGRMEMPSLWSIGFQQCRYSYYPASEVLSVAQNFRNRGIPADVLYLDIHYMQDYKVFTWNNTRFENPASFCKALSDMGFKVVVILDPGVKTEEGYTVWPGWAAFPDFTANKGRAWWASQMKELVETGMSGFWTDMNEPATWGQHMPDCIEFDYEEEGAAHKKARNIYGMQMARATHEGALMHNPHERPFVLTRAGFAGVQCQHRRTHACWGETCE